MTELLEALKHLLDSSIHAFGEVSPWVVAVLVPAMFLAQAWYRRYLKRRSELYRLKAILGLVETQLRNITAAQTGERGERSKVEMEEIIRRVQELEKTSQVPKAEFYKRLIEYLGNVETDRTVTEKKSSLE